MSRALLCAQEATVKTEPAGLYTHISKLEGRHGGRCRMRLWRHCTQPRTHAAWRALTIKGGIALRRAAAKMPNISTEGVSLKPGAERRRR
jgi:hypothetical protein